MKICTKCKLELPRDMFTKQEKNRDGLRSSCKKCSSVLLKEKYKIATAGKRRYDLEPNVEGYSNYHVTKDGQVISRVSGKNRIPGVGTRGYFSVDLYDGRGGMIRRNIHRLVALAYIPIEEGREIINHKNGNKRDNRVENLEWCTYSENTRHAFDTGLKVAKKGSESLLYGRLNEGASKPVICTTKEGEDITFESAREAVRQGYGINATGIGRCCNGYANKHNKMKWRYKK